MTDKEMRRMSRSELPEMLIAQMEENQALREQLEEAKKQLEDRTIEIEKAGSIAQAALALNGVFRSAELAAKQYTENLQQRAKKEADALIAQADAYSRKTRCAADEYLQATLTRAHLKEVDAAKGMRPHHETQVQDPGSDAPAGTAEGGTGTGEV